MPARSSAFAVSVQYLYIPPSIMVHVRLPVSAADGNNFVPCCDQAGYQIAANMARGTYDDDSHRLIQPFVCDQGEELRELVR